MAASQSPLNVQQPGAKASVIGAESLAQQPGTWQWGGEAKAAGQAPRPPCSPQLPRSSPGPHQHVLGQPALIPGQPRGDAKGKALLAQQGVATIAAAEGDDLPLVRHVANQGFLWVARPLVHWLPWGQWGHRADCWQGHQDLDH